MKNVFFFFFHTGDFSVLQVSFNMQRLSGYFLIQVRTVKVCGLFVNLASALVSIC